MAAAPPRRALFALPLLAVAGPARAEAGGPVVVAGLQATFSILAALTQGASVRALPAFPADIGMSQQSAWLARRARPTFLAAARQADAVVSIRAAWDGDPLFPEVRRQTIRAIEIDASRSFAPELAGVATLMSDGEGGRRALPEIWLSLTNAVRMTDIVAADLRRLAPDDAARIDANHAACRGRLLALRAAAEARLAALDDPAAILLSPKLAYLLGDLGIRIAASVAKPDFDWTEADRADFAARFAAAGTRLAVAAQPPSDAVAALIARLGGQVVALDPLDPGAALPDGQLDPQGYLAGQTRNLDAVLAGLGA